MDVEVRQIPKDRGVLTPKKRYLYRELPSLVLSRSRLDPKSLEEQQTYFRQYKKI